MEFVAFDTWAAVLEHVRSGAAVYYHPPLNFRPVVVKAFVRPGGKDLRVTPYDRDADPFTADEKHLDRFRRRV